jgi:hypothetical protein
VTREEAQRVVEELVRDAAALGEVMRSGTLAERKAIVPGPTQEIVLHPATGTGVAAFYKVPIVATVGSAEVTTRDGASAGSATHGGGARNEARSRLLEAATSRRAVAGAGSCERVTENHGAERVELWVFGLRMRMWMAA